MNKIIKIFSLILLIVGGLVLSVKAQPGQPPEMTQERLMKMIETDMTILQLTEDQKAPYTEVALKYADQLKALRPSAGERESKREEAGNIKKAQNEEMRELLTEAQYAAYLARQEERQKRRKKRRER